MRHRWPMSPHLSGGLYTAKSSIRTFCSQLGSTRLSSARVSDWPSLPWLPALHTRGEARRALPVSCELWIRKDSPDLAMMCTRVRLV